MDEELNEVDLSDEDDRMEVEDKSNERKEAIKDVFRKHRMIKSYVFDKKGEWCSFVISRKTTDERVDLVEVIAAAVQEIKIQGNGIIQIGFWEIGLVKNSNFIKLNFRFGEYQ